MVEIGDLSGAAERLSFLPYDIKAQIDKGGREWRQLSSSGAERLSGLDENGGCAICAQKDEPKAWGMKNRFSPIDIVPGSAETVELMIRLAHVLDEVNTFIDGNEDRRPRVEMLVGDAIVVGNFLEEQVNLKGRLVAPEIVSDLAELFAKPFDAVIETYFEGVLVFVGIVVGGSFLELGPR